MFAYPSQKVPKRPRGCARLGYPWVRRHTNGAKPRCPGTVVVVSPLLCLQPRLLVAIGGGATRPALVPDGGRAAAPSPSRSRTTEWPVRRRDEARRTAQNLRCDFAGQQGRPRWVAGARGEIGRRPLAGRTTDGRGCSSGTEPLCITRLEERRIQFAVPGHDIRPSRGSGTSVHCSAGDAARRDSRTDQLPFRLSRWHTPLAP